MEICGRVSPRCEIMKQELNERNNQIAEEIDVLKNHHTPDDIAKIWRRVRAIKNRYVAAEKEYNRDSSTA